MNKPEYLIIHHCGGSDSNPLLDTSNQTFEDVNEYHRQKWDFKSSLGYYIGYHYFIEKDGKMTQGRADTDEGAHTIGYNLKSLGICLAGNFDVTLPTEAQIGSLKWILRDKTTEYDISMSNIVPHRKFASKSCYGNHLSNDWAGTLLTSKPPAVPCVAEKDTIELQKKQIWNLQTLIANLIKYFK